MKAISLWQPWAPLWSSPAKVHETRHWRIAVPTARPLWLAVHAAKRIERDVDSELLMILTRHFGADWPHTLPRGAIIGAVEILGWYRTEDIVRSYGGWGSDDEQHRSDLACGNFAPGRFGWRRGAFRVLPEPVPWRGRQGLFEVPDEVLARGMGDLDPVPLALRVPDAGDIADAVRTAMAADPQATAERLVGTVMAATHGKASPEAVRAEIARRKP